MGQTKSLAGQPMNYTVSSPRLEELDRLIEIENAGFTPDEATTPEAFRPRIATIADSFISARNEAGEIVGYIVGPVVGSRYITDDLFKTTVPNPTTGGFQTVLSLAVHPDYRGKGISTLLLNELARVSRAAKHQAITLTCLAELVPYYEKNGYVNEGVSESQHAGEVWYSLVLALAEK